jgi:hypothetical protein
MSMNELNTTARDLMSVRATAGVNCPGLFFCP